MPTQTLTPAAPLIEPVYGSPAAALAVLPPWHVLWTRSHCEQLVHDQLLARGFRPYLPTLEVWSRRRGLRHRIRIPMFPGYVFLRNALDKHSDVEVRKARGVVALLGDGWDRRAVVPECEMQAIEKLIQSGLPALPHPFLKQGQRVRINRGPLADVEGILLRTKPNKGLLLLSVALLQRSVAVEVDCTLVAPV
jgi:transcription termination/antitermination protein NusG